MPAMPVLNLSGLWSNPLAIRPPRMRQALLAATVLLPTALAIVSPLTFTYVLAPHAQQRLPELIVSHEEQLQQYSQLPEQDSVFPVEADPFAACATPGDIAADHVSSSPVSGSGLLGYGISGTTKALLYKTGCDVTVEASMQWSMSPARSLHEGLVDIQIVGYSAHQVSNLDSYGNPRVHPVPQARKEVISAGPAAKDASRPPMPPGVRLVPPSDTTPAQPASPATAATAAAKPDYLAYRNMVAQQYREKALSQQQAGSVSAALKLAVPQAGTIPTPRAGLPKPGSWAYGRMVAQQAREQYLAQHQVAPTAAAAMQPVHMIAKAVRDQGLLSHPFRIDGGDQSSQTVAFGRGLAAAARERALALAATMAIPGTSSPAPASAASPAMLPGRAP